MSESEVSEAFDGAVAHGFQLRSGALLGLVRGALALLLGFGAVTHFD